MWIKGNLPFEATVGADRRATLSLVLGVMIDDGTPDRTLAGPITVYSPGDYPVVVEGFSPVPMVMSGGQWQGTVTVRALGDGKASFMIGFVCNGVSGTSNGCTLVPSVVTPPIPPQPPGGGTHPVTIVLDGKTYTGTVVG